MQTRSSYLKKCTWVLQKWIKPDVDAGLCSAAEGSGLQQKGNTEQIPTVSSSEVQADRTDAMFRKGRSDAKQHLSRPLKSLLQ